MRILLQHQLSIVHVGSISHVPDRAELSCHVLAMRLSVYISITLINKQTRIALYSSHKLIANDISFNICILYIYSTLQL